jgi:hypothetical protein
VTRILRGLSSEVLSCGCLGGIYETYDGEIVEILDAKAESCPVPTHQSGKIIPSLAPGDSHTLDPDTSNRGTRGR